MCDRDNSKVAAVLRDVLPTTSNAFPLRMFFEIINYFLRGAQRGVGAGIADVRRTGGDCFDDFLACRALIDGAAHLPRYRFVLTLRCAHRNQYQFLDLDAQMRLGPHRAEAVFEYRPAMHRRYFGQLLDAFGARTAQYRTHDFFAALELLVAHCGSPC